MSCAAGKTPAPGQAVYSASKYALNRYFHTLRSEFCQKGIKVTVVCPGRLETSNGYGATASEKKASSEKRVSSERCAELTNDNHCCFTWSERSLDIIPACTSCNVPGAVYANRWLLAHGQDW
ncbi:hypothetical protein LWI28_000261 [Acer negundo]|uniref:Uncharacterized protein n=1 Tax=Acer negundo TaxID=4023 RepID=A0AAD5J212_ACENE|nr:hypothetical protein LWI28_000261 [Acer negundo]